MSNYDMSDYVDVAERIREFRKAYPTGSLQPWNPDKPFEIVSVGERAFIVYTAAAYRTPDDQRPGIAVAWEPAVGKTNFTRDSELMNAETSAWGRAILACLAADSKRIASAEEVRNRRADQESPRSNVVTMKPVDEPERKVERAPARASTKPSEKQMSFLRSLMRQTETDGELVCSIVDASEIDALTALQAKNAIDALLRIKDGKATLVFDTNGKAHVQ